MWGLGKSKRKKEIELEREREREIPQAKNPPGFSDRGALSLFCVGLGVFYLCLLLVCCCLLLVLQGHFNPDGMNDKTRTRS